MADKPRRRWLVWVRRGLAGLGLGLAGVVTLGLLGAAGTWLWLRTESGNAFLAAQLESTVDGMLVEGDLDLGGLRTNVWSRVELSEVSLTRGDGSTVIGAQSLTVHLDPLSLLDVPHVHRVEGAGLEVDLVMGEDGLLELQRLLGTTEPSPPSTEPWGGLDLLVDAVSVTDSAVRYRQGDLDVRLTEVNLSGRVDSQGRRLEVADIQASARVHSPVDSPVRLRGSVAYTGDGVELAELVVELEQSRVEGGGRISGLEGDELDAELLMDVGALDLAEVDRMLALDLALDGDFSGPLEAKGPFSALAVSGRLTGQEATTGALDLAATLDVGAEGIPWSGQVTAAEVHVGHIMPSLGDELVLNGVLDARGSGTSWPDGIAVEGRYAGTRHHVYGLDLSKLEGGLRLDQGVLHLSAARAEGPLADMDLEGTVDLARGPMDLRVKGPFRLAELSAFGVEDVGGRGVADARVTGDILAEGTPIRVTGTARLAPVRYGADITVARAQASYEVDIAHGAIDVSADWLGWEGEVYGASMAELRGDRLVVHVAPDYSVTVEGAAEVLDITYPDYAHVSATEAEYTVDLPAQGEMVVWARGRTSHFDLMELPGTRGGYELKLRGDHLVFQADLADGARDFLVTAGSYDLANSVVDLQHLSLSPTPRQQWEAEGPVHLRLTESGVADARLSLASPRDEDGVPLLGAVHVDGTLGMSGPLDGSLRLEAFQLDTAAEVFPELAGGLSGRVDLDVALQGTGGAPGIQAEVDAQRVWVPGFSRWLDLSGSIEASDGSVRPDLLLGVAGEPLLTAYGTVPVVLDLSAPGLDPHGPVRLDLALKRGELERFEQLVVLECEDPDDPCELGLPSGRLSASLWVEGTLADPDLRLAGVTELDVPEWRLPLRVELEMERHGPELSWYADLREGFAETAYLKGAATTRLGEVTAWGLGVGPEPDLSDPTLYADQLSGGLVLTRVPIDRLASATGTPLDASGFLTGHVLLEGSPLRPEVRAQVESHGARLSEVELEQVELEVEPFGDQGYVVLAQAKLPDDSGGLVVEGLVPLRPDLEKETADWVTGELDVVVSGKGLPLALASAYDPGIVDASGLLVLQGTLGGSPLEPVPDLRLSVDQGALTYVPLGVVYDRIDLSLVAREDRVTLENLSLRTERVEKDLVMGTLDLGLRGVQEVREGVDELVPRNQDGQHPDGAQAPAKRGRSLVMSGQVDLEGYTPTAVQGSAVLKNLWAAHTDQQSAQVSGRVDVGGTWPALDVDGSLQLADGYLNADTAYWLEMAPLELDPSITVHRGLAEGLRPAVVAEDSEEASILDELDVQVDVDLNRSFTMLVNMPFIDDLGALGASATSATVDTLLDGTVSVKMDGGDLDVHGKVDVVEGTVKVLVSTLDLQEGQVSFVGSDYANPYLDLSAGMEVSGGGSIAMHIGGTAEEPEIELSSEDYPDQSQIMTVLVTGMDPENLDSTQGLGALVGLVGRGVAGGTSTANISFDTSGVRVGYPLGPWASVEGMWAPTTQSLDENSRELSAEVHPARGLLLSGTLGDQKSWVEMQYLRRFD